MTVETELAWAAGFVDGEGCFHTGSAVHKGGIRLQVSQADLRPLKRLKVIAGLGYINGPYGPYGVSKKPIWYFKLNVADTKLFLPRIWPYMSEPKKEQVQAALQKLHPRDMIQL